MVIQHITNEKIRSLVEVIWFVEEEKGLDHDVVMPTGHIHLVYNFGSPYTLVTNNTEMTIDGVALYGQFTKAIKVKYGPSVKQLGIAIRPSALYTIFHRINCLYLGSILDCRSIESMIPFHKLVYSYIENDQPVEALIKAIEAHLSPFVDDEPLVSEDLIGYIEARKGVIDVKVMAKAFSYSVSGLERLFKKSFGLTPKAYADIMRFRYAMMEELPQRHYYDQSHFIKNCRKYTSKKPADLEDISELTLLNMLKM